MRLLLGGETHTQDSIPSFTWPSPPLLEHDGLVGNLAFDFLTENLGMYLKDDWTASQETEGGWARLRISWSWSLDHTRGGG